MTQLNHLAKSKSKTPVERRNKAIAELCAKGMSRSTAYRRLSGVQVAEVAIERKEEVLEQIRKAFRLNANELARDLVEDLTRLRYLSVRAEQNDQLDLAISATSKAASVAANVLKGGWLANALSGRIEEGENLEELASEELEKRLKEFEVEGVELP